jgi:intergrase/recombinase
MPKMPVRRHDRAVGRCPPSDTAWWLNFENFLLQRMNKKSARNSLRYAQRYGYILISGNAQELLELEATAPDKCLHILKSLASFSRYQGCYDSFLQLRQKYGLKWTSGNEKLNALQRFFNDSLTLEKMLEWLKETIKQYPIACGNVLLYCTLLGVRPTEALESVKLVQNAETFKIYYNEEKQCLQHFKFPSIYVRRTKCAYVSLVDRETLLLAKKCPPNLSYDALRLRLVRRGATMNMHYCRKIFASHLSKNGVQTEIIDFLQGRVNKSVFVRHYLSPSVEYKERVLSVLQQLRNEISKSN